MTSETFPERLKLLIGSGSTVAFAKKCGIGDGTMRSYLDGRSVPGLDKAVAIAERSNVNLLWLATGQGPKEFSDNVNALNALKSTALVDSELLATILRSIIIWQQGATGHVDPKALSTLASVLYVDLSMRIGDAATSPRSEYIGDILEEIERRGNEKKKNPE